MASHNSTPASVLNAPSVTIITLCVHQYSNRYERRHWREEGTFAIGASLKARASATGKERTIPKRFRSPGLNTPYRKPAARG